MVRKNQVNNYTDIACFVNKIRFIEIITGFKS